LSESLAPPPNNAPPAIVPELLAEFKKTVFNVVPCAAAVAVNEDPDFSWPSWKYAVLTVRDEPVLSVE
jgi:hypothetical protein